MRSHTDTPKTPADNCADEYLRNREDQARGRTKRKNLPFDFYKAVYIYVLGGLTGTVWETLYCIGIGGRKCPWIRPQCGRVFDY